MTRRREWCCILEIKNPASMFLILSGLFLPPIIASQARPGQATTSTFILSLKHSKVPGERREEVTNKTNYNPRQISGFHSSTWSRKEKNNEFCHHKTVLKPQASMAFQSPSLAFILVFVTLLIIPISQSIPFVVIHGISDGCKHRGVRRFTEGLAQFSGSPGYCIEIGNGVWDSWFIPLDDQTQIACDKVKKMKELSEGYNIVGLSQGNLIARGLIEFCDGSPPVKNFISLAGPHAGTASVPLCGSGVFCLLADRLIKSEIYSDYIQDHLAPSGYLKLPMDIAHYMQKCRFLPKLNNEYPDGRYSIYKERFSSLQNLVLIMFEHDNVLIPRETSWFGYYPDGAFTPVVPAKELYKEDWIGLRLLDEAGRVHFVNVLGGHLGMSTDDMKKVVVPFLVDQESMDVKRKTIDHRIPRSTKQDHHQDRTAETTPTETILDGSSSYKWPPSVTSFFSELVGLDEESESDNMNP